MRTSLALLLLAAAATAVCLLPSATATEPNDAFSNASVLSPGPNGPFDIDPYGDQDYYVFTLAERSGVRIETNGSAGDPTLYLYDENQSYIAYDDDSGVNAFSRIALLLDAGTYYVLMQALSGFSTIYNYTITLDAAVPSLLSEGLNGPYNLSAPGLHNWSQFEVVETSTVTLLLNGTSGDPEMYLYDVNLTYWDYDNNGGPGLWSRIDITLTAGTYYVAVRPYSDFNVVVDYYLNLTRVSLAGPDGNGIPENATAISLGLNGPYDIDPLGDQDYYVITFGSDGFANFSTGGPLTSYLYMGLYDTNLTWMAQDYASLPNGHSGLEAPVYAGMRAFILITHPTSSTVYNYTLDVGLSPVPVPDNNGDRTGAIDVGLGENGPYSLTRYDVDWYRYDASGPGTLRAETNGPLGGAQIWIHDAVNTTIAYPSGTGNFSFQYASALVDAGTYWIRVVPTYNVLVVREYNLTITFTPWVSTDGNDFRSQAQRIVQGLNGPFSLQPAADIDWYFFDLSDAGTVVLQIFGGQGQASLELQNSTGGYLSGGVYGTQQVSLNLQPSRYFAKIQSTYGYYAVSGFYLNLTVPDLQPPTITAISPANGTQVDNGAVLIAARTEPGSQVWVNNKEVVVDINGSFSEVVMVAIGQNAITIIAVDPAGHQSVAVVTVVGVERFEALSNQVNQTTAQLTAAQQQLAAERAAAAAAAAQASADLNAANTRANQTQSQLDTTNGTLAAVRAEADAARGLAFASMALGVLGLAAAVAVAFLAMRKRGPPPVAAQPPAAAPMPAAPVVATVSSAPAAPPATVTPVIATFGGAPATSDPSNAQK